MILRTRALSKFNLGRLGFTVLTLLVLAVAGYFFIKYQHTAFASSIDWTLSDPTVTLNTDRSISDTYPDNNVQVCQNQDIYIGNDTTSTSVCVYHAKSFRIGMYYACLSYSGPYCSATTPAVLIGLGDDSRMYKVANLSGPSYSWKVSSDSDNILFIQSGTMYVVNDLTGNLVPSVVNGATQYSVPDSAKHYFNYDEQNNYQTFGPANMSNNGEWATAELPSHGLVKINLNDYSMDFFTNDVRTYGHGTNPGYEFAVSNDGQFIAQAGGNVPTATYDTSGGCGTSATVLQSSWVSANAPTNNCPSKALDALITAAANNGATYNWSSSDMQFSDDGGQLYLIANLAGGTSSGSLWMTLTAANYEAPASLDYLALGDSYSSGEGDIADPVYGTDPYLMGTDFIGNKSVNQPEEMCHISSRSYPFLLSLYSGITSDSMKSVACSGALRTDVQGWSPDIGANGYKGQNDSSGNPRLKNLSPSDLMQQQSDALHDFIPGRIQQIDFVKQYKPKVITLTLGGNDVNFANILKTCIMTYPPDADCDSATDAGRRQLGDLIAGEFTSLRDVYTDLKVASPGSKIYVVGYPQFINSNNSVCETNIPLNSDETMMATQSVTYLNSVIEAAAGAAGVNYVNIENSLGEHTLCGTDLNKSVNGIVDGLIAQSYTSMFHPNDKGQAEIAQAFENGLNHQSLANFNSCEGNTTIICPEYNTSTPPPVPDYFTPPNTIDQIVTFANFVKDATDSGLAFVKMGASQIISVDPLVFQPDTTVNVEIHSDPVSLGDFTTNDNGSLSGDITIPTTIAAGFHTIHIQGTSFTGQSIDYEQIIEVHGPNDDDVDNNGIVDSSQKCLFVTPSNTDTDFDGIDDACDPYINPNPQIYRVRHGDPARTYNGVAENLNYLYVERNIYAGSVTGVTGDSDPDGDGWAIVGASQGTPYTDTSVSDTAPSANFVVSGTGSGTTPDVYIRAGGYGCVEFTPTSLSQVIPGENRTLKIVAENTNMCRSDPASADDDGNGIPDNTQPIYMARKGNPTVEHTKSDGTTFYEDLNKLYIFRNFYSSEAQLGISDYSPTGTAAGNADQPIQVWNLLASTQTTQTIPGYDNLAMIQDSNGKPLPIILTKKLNGQCIAYEPASTDIIKMTTQYTRDITKLSSLPQGANCD